MLEKIDEIFPQSQCSKCDYSSGRKYADNIETINQCVPGGEQVILKITQLLNEPLVLKADKQNRIAFIDEQNCIGCTKCIKSCPVNAIIGTNRVIHSVVKQLCTGCEICVANCPTDCITMLTINPTIKHGLTNIPVHILAFTENQRQQFLLPTNSPNQNNGLTQFTLHKIWSFSGGIHLPDMKKPSNTVPLRRIPLADQLIIPIQQHVGAACHIIVKTGDYVLKGQVLTKSQTSDQLLVHASTSGRITAIIPHLTVNQSGIKELICIHLQPDFLDKWCECKSLPNYLQYSANTLLAYIEQAGISGLGSVGFATATKLQNSTKINTLIINATECEPYLTANDGLMQEHAHEIIEGILILIHILQPKDVLIGIEDNQPAAIVALQKALFYQKKDLIKIIVIPTKYPSGGVKQLTKILTGKDIPTEVNWSGMDILMQNVSTVFAIKRAIINGEPLIERLITLTGSAIQQPGNYWVPLGVPVSFILQQVELVPQAKPIVIMGGPLMGYPLPNLTIPIVKISNCILIYNVVDVDIEGTKINQACIKCDLCTKVCPANLLAQKLYWLSIGQEHQKTQQNNLFDCIECGACTYVCPSNIPLVEYYRKEKAVIQAMVQEKQRSTNAQKRLDNKKKLITQKHILDQNKTQTTSIEQLTALRKEAIAAAIARAKAKFKPSNSK